MTTSSVIRFHRDEEGPAFAFDQQQDRTVGRLANRRSKLIDRLHRLTIDFEDDVAFLKTRIRGAAVGIQ